MRTNIPINSSIHLSSVFIDSYVLSEKFPRIFVDTSHQGYANSGLALTVTMFCHELATLHDNSTDILTQFSLMKPSFSELRNSADAAALLVLDFDYCGVAWGNTVRSGNTFSVTRKVE